MTGIDHSTDADLLNGSSLADEFVLNGSERTDGLVSDRTHDLIRRRRSGHTHRRGWLIKRALATADVIGLLCAFAIAEIVFGPEAGGGNAFGTETEATAFVLSIPLWLLLARAYGLYSRDEARTDHSTVDDMIGVFNMITVGTWAFFVITWPTSIAHPSVRQLVLFWVTAIVLVGTARGVARTVCRRMDAYAQNTIIVGTGEIGRNLAYKLAKHPKYGVNLVGFVDHRSRLGGPDMDGVLGDLGDLPYLVQRFDVERVILAFSQSLPDEELDAIRSLYSLDVQIDIVPRLYEVVGPTASIHGAEGMPLLGLPAARLGSTSVVLKRTMDVTLSGLGLLILSPFFLVTAIAIKLDSPGPVFFRQVRIGRGDRPFEIVKFRTMTADAEARKNEVTHLNKHSGGDDRMFKVANDPRITRVGRFLRSYSLDEFPQLINVLKNDMTLVGPRPLIPDEHRHVDGWAARRLDLKPGVTGLWQVLGRDDIPFGEMVGLDYRYVTTWSLTEDIRLLVKTIPAVLWNKRTLH